jgi:predicted secreted protein
MKKAVICVLILLLGAQTWAGDMAQFVNLGFSNNGRYLMFGQYGFAQEKSETYASIFMVDVQANLFLPQGIFNQTVGNWPNPGATADGLFFTLLESASPLRRKFNINYLQKGRLLYIASSLVDGAATQANLTTADIPLSFRDFQDNKEYEVSLRSIVNGSGVQVSSSFKIMLTITDGAGRRHNYEVGHPTFIRNGVSGYSIEQVLLAPNNGLVFVVARHEYSPSGGNNIRYMVETLVTD